jgi:hypothetical protein
VQHETAKLGHTDRIGLLGDDDRGEQQEKKRRREGRGYRSFLTETSLESRASACLFCPFECHRINSPAPARRQEDCIRGRFLQDKEATGLPTLLFSSSIGTRHGPHRHALHWLPSPAATADLPEQPEPDLPDLPNPRCLPPCRTTTTLKPGPR